MHAGTSGATPCHVTPTCIIVGEAPVKLWGITGAERLRRALGRTPVTDVHHRPDGSLDGLELTDTVVLLQASYAYDNAIIAKLVETPGVAVHPPDGRYVAALHVSKSEATDLARRLLSDVDNPDDPESVSLPGLELEELPDGVDPQTPEQLCGAYNNKLRKREVPYLLKVTKRTKPAIQKRMFAGSYKGVTDIVTKYVFPLPSRIITGWVAELHFKPNHITFIGLLCVLASIYLWWIGEFAWGLLAAWTMCLLDTVDGKLARVTLTSSKFGDVFDHAIDLIHPPFWYWAWIVGLGDAFDVPYKEYVLPAIVATYILQRLQEGYFIKVFGIEMHIWRRFDSFFRSITARRDPNLLVLTIAWALGYPAEGIAFIAVWAVFSLLVHQVQIIQAHIAAKPIGSWLSDA